MSEEQRPTRDPILGPMEKVNHPDKSALKASEKHSQNEEIKALQTRNSKLILTLDDIVSKAHGLHQRTSNDGFLRIARRARKALDEDAQRRKR